MTTTETKTFVRIKEIEFKNFRNITSSSIEFPNTKMMEFMNGEPSILGLYGQNGSGKSSVIMSLGILKEILSGRSLSNRFRSCIQFGFDRCNLKYKFDVICQSVDEQNEPIFEADGIPCFEVEYSFDITTELNEDLENEMDVNHSEVLVIENEILKYRMTDTNGNVEVSKQTFINTSAFANKKVSVFGSKEKDEIYGANDETTLQQYRDVLAVTRSKSQSFIFSTKTISLLLRSLKTAFPVTEETEEKYLKKMSEMATNADQYSDYIKNLGDQIKNDSGFTEYWASSYLFETPVAIIQMLSIYGKLYLHVIDTVTTGLTNINTKLPLLLWTNFSDQEVHSFRMLLELDKPTCVEEKFYDSVKRGLRSVSDVLEKIVPGIKLNIIDNGIQRNEKNVLGHYFDIVSVRNNVTIPLKYESDGIRRIVSILSLLIAGFNDRSFTIAVDEIDSGIFEYLLGEILSVMVDNAKGQLVFTSHNLRPLEVLPSKYLCFTTTKPSKRFTKISSRGNNNLRDKYFRSIVLNTEKDPIYNSTDKYEIELAFYKAGHLEGDSDE